MTGTTTTTTTCRRVRRLGAGAGAVLVLAAALATGLAAGAETGAAADDRLERNIEVVFDTSGSMNENNKIGQAKQSLSKFLAGVPDGTNVGLIIFDNGRPKRVLPLGPLDRSKIGQIVASLVANGPTPIRDSLVVAAESLRARREKQGGYGTYGTLVVTDGEETVNYHALPGTVNSLQQNGIGIDVIGFDIAEAHSLKRLVTRYRDARNEAELTQAILDTLAESESYDEVAQFVAEEASGAYQHAAGDTGSPYAGGQAGALPAITPQSGGAAACCYALALLGGGCFVAFKLRRPAKTRGIYR